MKRLLKNAPVACLLGSIFFVSGCFDFNRFYKPTAASGVKITGSTMGTFYEVTLGTTLYSENGKPANPAEKIEALLIEYNRQMSTYDPASEISTFNSSLATEWFAVSTEFAEVAQEAIDIARLTDGAFDPTVGPLVNLWNFGPEQNELIVPDAETIEKTRQIVGYQQLEVRLNPPALRKSIPELQLDLSAIAKGAAVDQVAEFLTAEGFDNYLVNIGGEVRAAGYRSGTLPWRVAIEKPIEQGRAIEQVVPLNEQSMATSGDYRNFYRLADRKYSHTINPATGAPVEHDLHSVSVVAETCSQADAFATALMVMGPERAWQFASQQQLLVYLISGSTQPLKIQQSVNFPTLKTGD